MRRILEYQTLMSGIAFGESPRWYENRLWFSNWVAQEVVALDLKGKSEVILRMPSFPFSIDWLPSGSLLLVSGREGLLLCREADGSLVTYSNLNGLAKSGWNEIVVDGRGNAYVNGGPGIIALVTPDGSARQVAQGIAFPNGMAITPDNSTLIIAESFGRRLTAFEIEYDGSLSNQRVWAGLGDGTPDGICIDAEGAVWYGDVPNKRCVRVSEGNKVLQTICLDRGCFACMLGGADRKTLFMMAAEWHGFDKMTDAARTGQVLTAEVSVPGVGWP